jgi:hypothetical protein
MKLDRITMTGADNSIDPFDLVKISNDFPDRRFNQNETYVEWGILVSPRTLDGGRDRYPSMDWIDKLKLISKIHNLKLSLHICGGWSRNLLLGKIEFPESLLEGFQRVQLNFHAEKNPCCVDKFVSAMHRLDSITWKKQWLFQVDGVLGNKYFEAVHENGSLDVAPIFDASGGLGISPKEWPRPQYHQSGYAFSPPLPIEWLYHGYAGGLGPENLEEEINRISAVLRDSYYSQCRVWLDMETKVRSDEDRLFDLKKVRTALELSEPYVFRG